MVKTEAPAYAKAAGNSYSLHLPLARLSSTLQLHRGKHVAYINAAPKARGSLCLTLDTDDIGVAHALDAWNFIGK